MIKNISFSPPINDTVYHNEQLSKLKISDKKYLSKIRTKCIQYQKQDETKHRIPIYISKFDGIHKKDESTNHIIDISDRNQFVSDIYLLLINSNLICYYCKDDIFIEYNKSNRMKQWTLDRIDNNNNHNVNNCVISCLQCNLVRRNRNHIRFKNSKQLKINKIE